MNDHGDWLRQMAQLQQQYWDGWRNTASQAMGSAPGVTAPWQDSLNAWQRGFAPSGIPAASAFSVGGQNEVIERMLTYGKQYLGLLQGLMSGSGFSAGNGQFDPRAWLEEARTLQQRYGQGLAGGLGKLQSMPWFGGVDSAQVEQMVRAFTAGSGGMQEELRGWLSLPTFGLAREHQDRGQALLRAWLDYQNANQRYNELMLRSTVRTLDVLESKLAERDEPGRRIETARALYDLWIDAAEEAFAKIALSQEYREIYGELTNAQMRVRAGLNAEIERFAGQFGMPTRTEVDAIARQLHELKRELRRIKGTSSTAAADVPARKVKAAAPLAKQVEEIEQTEPPVSRVSDKGAKRKQSGGKSAAPILKSTARKTAKGG